MRIPLTVTVFFVVLSASVTEAQFGFGGFRNIFQPLQNFLQPVMRGVQNIFGGGPKFRDDGTKAPQATGVDKLFPDDCGRDEDKGTGKLCFPDGLLCQESELSVPHKTWPSMQTLVYVVFTNVCLRIRRAQ